MSNPKQTMRVTINHTFFAFRLSARSIAIPATYAVTVTAKIKPISHTFQLI